MINFFKTWEEGRGEVTEAQKNKKAQPSQLEKQVSPGRGRSGAAHTPSEPKMYTPQDIKSFFADVQKGKYKGREEERDRIERDIFAAQREGRINTT